MGLRCRVGDMARLDHPMLEENNGLIVEVVEFVGNIRDGCPAWLTKSAWPARCVYEGVGIALHPVTLAVTADCRLTPIIPPAPPESVDTPENVEATA